MIQFKINGIKFAITKNYNANEFESSHKLSFLNGYGSWQKVTTCDSVREAITWYMQNKAYFM